MTTTGDTHKPRGGKGQFTRSADTAERDAEACRLRSLGMTYDEIAKAVGFTDRSTARHAIERALIHIVQEPAEEVRKLELLRLDEIWRGVREIFHKRHPTVQHGKVVYGPDGLPIEDHAIRLAAATQLLKVMERRAKLLGLDAPRQLEVYTLDAIQAEIRDLEKAMAAREAELASNS